MPPARQSKVTRVQVRAAKGRIEIVQPLGRETRDWIRRIAAAKPSRKAT